MPKRQVFFSFHFDNDVWRAAQVKNIGVVEGNESVSANEWEEIKRKGDESVKRWIDDQLGYRSCTVVLAGSETSNRKWVKYEITRSWELGKGVVGICIHNLKDEDGNQSEEGTNPFSQFKIGDIGFDKIVKLYDPPFSSSKYVYEHIEENIEDWVEEAIKIREEF